MSSRRKYNVALSESHCFMMSSISLPSFPSEFSPKSSSFQCDEILSLSDSMFRIGSHFSIVGTSSTYCKNELILNNKSSYLVSTWYAYCAWILLVINMYTAATCTTGIRIILRRIM